MSKLEWDKLDNQGPKPQAKTSEDDGGFLEYAGGFLGNTAWEMGPGLIGVEPGQDSFLGEWRAENPGSALVSAIGGMAVPLAGWYKASTKIPKMVSALDKVADANKLTARPFRAAASREVVRWAPFEAGRVALGATGGEAVADATEGEYVGTGELAQRASADLLLGAGIGGGLETLGAAGKAFKKKHAARSGADLNTSLQDQLKDLDDAITQGKVVDPDSAKAAFSRVAKDIRLEVPKEGRYVGKLEGGADTRSINRLFKPGEGTATAKKLFANGTAKKYFDSFDEVKAAMDKVGISESDLGHMQYPRWMKTKNDRVQKHIKKTIKKNLKPLDTERGLFYRLDEEDGLFTMARQVDKDEWVLFKTNNPERFAPGAANWKAKMEAHAAKFARPEADYAPLGMEGTKVYDAVAGFRNSAPIPDFRGLKDTKRWLGQLSNNELTERGKVIIRDYLAPAQVQFRNSPMAAHIYAAGKVARDTAEATAERLFLGGKVVAGQGKNKNLFSELWAGTTHGDGKSIKNLLREVHKNRADWQAFQKSVIAGVGPDDAVREFNLSQKGVDLLQELNRVDMLQAEGKRAIQKATGAAEFEPRPWHYMISRTWKGDQRVPLYEGNRLVYMASGEKRGHAISEAERVIAEAKKDGIKLRMGHPTTTKTVDRELELLKGLNETDAKRYGKLRVRMMMNKSAPKRMTEEREGIGGFVGDRDLWKLDFVEESIFKQLRDYQLHNAKLSLEHMYQSQLSKLLDEDPALAQAVKGRLDDMFGIQGKIPEAINEVSDKVLSPVLGNNSASKITTAANKAMFHLTFGFMNTSFNIANMLTFAQTAFPHMAYIANAPATRVARDYIWYPVAGQKSVNGIGVLDMFKIAGRSFKNMARPDKTLRRHFERSLAEGVTDPKFVEEWVGQGSTKVRDLKAVMSGDEPFSNWLGAVSKAVPSMTEKFARGHSFVLGHTFFRDTMGITDEELLYQLAKQFTEKTQFMYSTADRAKIMTGPLGGAFGLFKNWITHYISWMGAYTDEAFMHKNWKPLAWMLGSTTAVGGVGALPFYSAADSVSKWLSDDTLFNNMYSAFGPDEPGETSLADGMFYGIPGFLGFSIQNQVAMPGADPGQDAEFMTSFAYWNRLKYVQKALGSAIDAYSADGQHPITDGRTRDLFVRAFMPKSIYQAQQAVKSDVLRSFSTGYPVTDLTPGERLFHGLGLNPRWLDQQFRVANELWQDKEKMKNAVSTYGKSWSEAVKHQDWAEAKDIMLRAMAQGVDVSSVIRSGKVRLRNENEDQVTRNNAPEDVWKYMQTGLTGQR